MEKFLEWCSCVAKENCWAISHIWCGSQFFCTLIPCIMFICARILTLLCKVIEVIDLQKPECRREKNSWNGVHVWQRKIAEPFLIFGAVPKHIIIQAQSEPSWQISWQFCGDDDNNYLTGNPSSQCGYFKAIFQHGSWQHNFRST